VPSHRGNISQLGPCLRERHSTYKQLDPGQTVLASADKGLFEGGDVSAIEGRLGGQPIKRSPARVRVNLERSDFERACGRQVEDGRLARFLVELGAGRQQPNGDVVLDHVVGCQGMEDKGQFAFSGNGNDACRARETH
jgi:hypothetical protein